MLAEVLFEFDKYQDRFLAVYVNDLFMIKLK